MDDINKIDRAQKTQQFMGSIFYKDYFRPYLEGKVRQYKNIKEIDKGDVEKSFWGNFAKMEVYRSIINLFDRDWTEIKIKNEKGGD